MTLAREGADHSHDSDGQVESSDDRVEAAPTPTPTSNTNTPGPTSLDDDNFKPSDTDTFKIICPPATPRRRTAKPYVIREGFTIPLSPEKAHNRWSNTIVKSLEQFGVPEKSSAGQGIQKLFVWMFGNQGADSAIRLHREIRQANDFIIAHESLT